MSTPETTHTGLTLYMRQVKESSYEQSASGAYDVLTELPGFLEFCVDVEGVPVILHRIKAPGLLADIARAKASPSEPTPPAQ